MTVKTCKHCGEVPETTGVGLGNQCRICKNGLYRYGMTRTDMLKLHESQNRQCFICETDIEMFRGTAGGNIDHCHTTGKVRGILCSACNTTIGGIEAHLKIHDDISRLLEYIEN